MSPWQRIKMLPITGFLFLPGNDGLRPYERRRMARRYERTVGAMPKRSRAEVEQLFLTAPRVRATRDADGHWRIQRHPDGGVMRFDPTTGELL